MSATHVRQKARVARDLLLLSVRGGMKFRQRTSGAAIKCQSRADRVPLNRSRRRTTPIRFLPV